eukprot:TRINITY_DN9835_c0_g1_i1.p1 TRINITY_DN9835_c0_g1~~TRINITY_DN9835_c0_g1_i1.p1  ORF type:complete len:593 (-),score=103.12 TRINITY_DN9835_c0_g1_i1:64-1716(-)
MRQSRNKKGKKKVVPVLQEQPSAHATNNDDAAVDTGTLDYDAIYEDVASDMNHEESIDTANILSVPEPTNEQHATSTKTPIPKQTRPRSQNDIRISRKNRDKVQISKKVSIDESVIEYLYIDVSGVLPFIIDKWMAFAVLLVGIVVGVVFEWWWKGWNIVDTSWISSLIPIPMLIYADLKPFTFEFKLPLILLFCLSFVSKADKANIFLMYCVLIPMIGTIVLIIYSEKKYVDTKIANLDETIKKKQLLYQENILKHDYLEQQINKYEKILFRMKLVQPWLETFKNVGYHILANTLLPGSSLLEYVIRLAASVLRSAMMLYMKKKIINDIINDAEQLLGTLHDSRYFLAIVKTFVVEINSIEKVRKLGGTYYKRLNQFLSLNLQFTENQELIICFAIGIVISMAIHPMMILIYCKSYLTSTQLIAWYAFEVSIIYVENRDKGKTLTKNLYADLSWVVAGIIYFGLVMDLKLVSGAVLGVLTGVGVFSYLYVCAEHLFKYREHWSKKQELKHLMLKLQLLDGEIKSLEENKRSIKKEIVQTNENLAQCVLL